MYLVACLTFPLGSPIGLPKLNVFQAELLLYVPSPATYQPFLSFFPFTINGNPILDKSLRLETLDFPFFLFFSLHMQTVRKSCWPQLQMMSGNCPLFFTPTHTTSHPGPACIISCLNYCRGLLTFLQLLILLSYSLLSTQHRLDHVILPLQILQWLLTFRLKATVLTMTYLTLYLSPPPPPQLNFGSFLI